MFNIQRSMFRYQRIGLPHIVFLATISFFFTSCSSYKQIAKSADEDVLKNKALLAAHIGLSIYEPETGKYWYNHQGDKYFVPASNTKIPTCYAAMKYLKDSLPGLRVIESGTSLFILPTGDPTLLHPDFRSHPVYNYLKKDWKTITISDHNWKDDALGSGWSWNDFNEAYMMERSPLPVYGNLLKWIQEREDPAKPAIIYSLPEINWEINFNSQENASNFYVQRDLGKNAYELTEGKEKYKLQTVPFKTFGVKSAVELLNDSLGIQIRSATSPYTSYPKVIYSQPTDSLLKPMMHRSDNFFAEQSLLMVSNEMLGYMSDNAIIDTLLKADFKDLPQRPRWADGSGLSRYNLFTPQDFVMILNKMKNEFGMERIKEIFATGGEGTISSYYKADSTFIYAKTGTLSGVVALSGFLYTKKGKLLIFSTLVNNHQASATEVRRSIEKFLQGVREKF